MKAVGAIIAAIGVIGALLVLDMDTSVQALGGRVNNLGLMAYQQNYLLVFIATTIVGIVLLNRRKVSPQAAQPSSTSATRTCPYCAEEVNTRAILCKFCRSQLEPVEAEQAVSSQQVIQQEPIEFRLIHALDEKAKSLANAVEQYYLQSTFAQKSLSALSRTFAVSLLASGIALFGAGIFLMCFYYWVYDPSEIYRASEALQSQMSLAEWEVIAMKRRWTDVAAITAFGFFLMCNTVLVQGRMAAPQTEPSTNTNKAVVTLFGKTVNLVVVQFSLFLLLLLLAFFLYVEELGVVASVGILLGWLLLRRRCYFLAAVTTLPSIIYLVFLHEVMESQARSYAISMVFMRDSLTNDLGRYGVMILLAVAVPHLAYLRLGNLRFGGFRGDFRFNLFGHNFVLPFVSAFFVLLSLYAFRCIYREYGFFT